MEVKQCSVCKKHLPVTAEFFHRSKSHKGGFKPACKQCRNRRNKEYNARPNVKERAKERGEKYNKDNAEMLKSKREARKEQKKEYDKIYREKNHEHLKATSLKRRRKNVRNKAEYDRNRRPQLRKDVAERYNSDEQFRLSRIMGMRTLALLTHNLVNGKCCATLGATSEFMESYLETLFYNNPNTNEEMTWENRGVGPNTWQIHHIEPKSQFDLTVPEQFALCAHWTNIQPLWHCDHLERHSTK